MRSKSGARGPWPALFTSTSIRPHFEVARSVSRARSSGDWLEPVTPTPPSSLARASPFPEEERRATWYPSLASLRAASAPIPLPAAVSIRLHGCDSYGSRLPIRDRVVGLGYPRRYVRTGEGGPGARGAANGPISVAQALGRITRCIARSGYWPMKRRWRRGNRMYRDPYSGYCAVMTAGRFGKRGDCCDLGCRHCPYVDREIRNMRPVRFCSLDVR